MISRRKFEPETSSAMGFGFRCGFLGLLHMEIVQERLEKEYNLSLITTAPSVVYRVHCVNGDTVECSNSSLLLEPRKRKSIEDFLSLEKGNQLRSHLLSCVQIEMLTPKDYIGSLMELAQERRGQLKEMKFIAENRASIMYELPLAEMVGDFFDQLKSRSKGYASMEYTFVGFFFYGKNYNLPKQSNPNKLLYENCNSFHLLNSFYVLFL
ncbi:Translation factor GUF1 like, chloroplastic [Glycine soja]|uniref:Translation factor GUF1 like, chloroplastic n=1 Tax=Glycine soja TaxID=3848 RepID=A0A0B2QQK9_GLYSO|nr:Translation factor GUF1 like, chloroplastic [Glycine soja]